MTQHNSFNGVSTFLVKDNSSDTYTRLTPKQIARRKRLADFKAMFSLWSALLVVGLVASTQAYA